MRKSIGHSELSLALALYTVGLTLRALPAEVTRTFVRVLKDDEKAIDKAKAKRLRRLTRNQEILKNQNK